MSIEEKYDEVRQLISIGKEKATCCTTKSTSCCRPRSPRPTSSTTSLIRSAARASRSSTPKRRTCRKSSSTGRPRAARRWSWTSRRARSTRRTTRSACTCARWARCRCSRAKAKWKSPGASSAASWPSSSRSPARRPWRRTSSRWAISSRPARAPSASS